MTANDPAPVDAALADRLAVAFRVFAAGLEGHDAEEALDAES